MKPHRVMGGALLLLAFGASPALAQDAAAIDVLQQNIDIVWTLVAAILVMFMQPGFAMLEAGLTQAKNAVNIMMKNMMDFSIGSLAFFLVGFGIMFGSTSNGWCGSTLFALEGDASLASPEARLVWRGQGTEESIDVVRLANYHRRRSSPAPATWKSRSTSFTGARS